MGLEDGVANFDELGETGKLEAAGVCVAVTDGLIEGVLVSASVGVAQMLKNPDLRHSRPGLH